MAPRTSYVERDIRNALIDLGAEQQSVRDAAVERLIELREAAVEPLAAHICRGGPKGVAWGSVERLLRVLADAATPALEAWLNEGAPTEAAQAVRALACIDTEAARAPLRRYLLQDPQVRESTGASALLGVSLCVLALLVTGFSLAMVADSVGSSSVAGGLVAGPMLGGPLFAGGLALLTNSTPQDVGATARYALQALAGHEDVGLLGVVTQCLASGDPGLVKAGTAALARISLLVRPEDASVIGAEGMSALVRGLQMDDPRVCRAVLTALEYVGGSQALPAVEMLASGRGTCGGDAEVRKAARACLVVLRERADRGAEAGRLVRASRATDDSLVRPAGTTAEPEENLLRPSGGE